MIIPLFAFGFSPGPMELVIIAAIGVLLFGKRLPEVGRSLGRSIIEFKKGVNGIESDIDSAAASGSGFTSDHADDDCQATAPKFEPPKGEPKDETAVG